MKMGLLAGRGGHTDLVYHIGQCWRRLHHWPAGRHQCMGRTGTRSEPDRLVLVQPHALSRGLEPRAYTRRTGGYQQHPSDATRGCRWARRTVAMGWIPGGQAQR